MFNIKHFYLRLQDTHHEYVHHDENKHIEQAYIGQRLARIPKDELYMVHRSPTKKQVSEILLLM